ncbi:MAG: hypothetical protein GY720_18695, partial [bacterium]|nr:hypothetical protein [bacterium]
MSTEARAMAKRAASAEGGLGTRIYGFLKAIPTWILWGLVVLWTIPTFGLFVNSFRPRDGQRSSGWWTVFTGGSEGGLTLDNYQQVLTSGTTDSLADALLNSLAIAIPATIIPIAIAAFAAYAFAWIDFRGRELLF